MTDSLTKENFWNAMMEAYPEQMEEFCAWIDEYKKKVEWNKLFNHKPVRNGNEWVGPSAPKYHNLPIAMQFGIFMEFTSESDWEYSVEISSHPCPDEYRGFIKCYFENNKPS